MKISQIITEVLSHDMALVKLPIVAREMGNVVSDFTREVDDAVQWNDPGQLLPAVGKIANWVTTNYKSSKSRPGGENLESLLQLLSHHPKYRDIATKCLSEITFNMDRELKQSALAQFSIILSAIIRILDSAKIKNNLVAVLHQYQGTLGKYKELRKVKMADRGIDTRPAPAKSAKQLDISSSQRAQAETVVNHILSSLPPKIASEIRAAISKSDNKLQALKLEMDKRGI